MYKHQGEQSLNSWGKHPMPMITHMLLFFHRISACCSFDSPTLRSLRKRTQLWSKPFWWNARRASPWDVDFFSDDRTTQRAIIYKIFYNYNLIFILRWPTGSVCTSKQDRWRQHIKGKTPSISRTYVCFVCAIPDSALLQCRPSLHSMLSEGCHSSDLPNLSSHARVGVLQWHAWRYKPSWHYCFSELRVHSNRKTHLAFRCKL